MLIRRPTMRSRFRNPDTYGAPIDPQVPGAFSNAFSNAFFV